MDPNASTAARQPRVELGTQPPSGSEHHGGRPRAKLAADLGWRLCADPGGVGRRRPGDGELAAGAACPGGERADGCRHDLAHRAGDDAAVPKLARPLDPPRPTVPRTRGGPVVPRPPRPNRVLPSARLPGDRPLAGRSGLLCPVRAELYPHPGGDEVSVRPLPAGRRGSHRPLRLPAACRRLQRSACGAARHGGVRPAAG